MCKFGLFPQVFRASCIVMTSVASEGAQGQRIRRSRTKGMAEGWQSPHSVRNRSKPHFVNSTPLHYYDPENSAVTALIQSQWTSWMVPQGLPFVFRAAHVIILTCAPLLGCNSRAFRAGDPLLSVLSVFKLDSWWSPSCKSYLQDFQSLSEVGQKFNNW